MFFFLIIFQAMDAAKRKESEQLSETDESTRAAMRSVYWMAKEDLPMNKYASLMDFLKV